LGREKIFAPPRHTRPAAAIPWVEGRSSERPNTGTANFASPLIHERRDAAQEFPMQRILTGLMLAGLALATSGAAQTHEWCGESRSCYQTPCYHTSCYHTSCYHTSYYRPRYQTSCYRPRYQTPCYHRSYCHESYYSR